MRGGALVAQNMGEGSREVFSGVIEKIPLKLLYSESAKFFAELIKDNLSPRTEPYKLLDVGSFKGELLKNIIAELDNHYKLNTTGIDINEKALGENNILDNKVVADLAAMPFEDDSFDLSEARYVLVWNSPERQRDILREINRVSNELAIIQHAGADDLNTTVWQEKMHSLLHGGVEKLLRPESYFSSADEIEGWMKDLGIKFKRVQHRRVDKVSQVFIERYKLDKEGTNKTLQILGDKDYIFQTTWIIKKAE